MARAATIVLALLTVSAIAAAVIALKQKAIATEQSRIANAQSKKAVHERVRAQTQLAYQSLTDGDTPRAVALLARAIEDDPSSEFPLNRLAFRFWQPVLSALADELGAAPLPAVVNWREQDYLLDHPTGSQNQVRLIGKGDSYLWAVDSQHRVLITVEPAGVVKVRSIEGMSELMSVLVAENKKDDDKQPAVEPEMPSRSRFRVEHIFDNGIPNTFVIAVVDEASETAASREWGLGIVNYQSRQLRLIESVDAVSDDCRTVQNSDGVSIELRQEGASPGASASGKRPLSEAAFDSGSCGAVKSIAQKTVQVNFPNVVSEESFWSVASPVNTRSQASSSHGDYSPLPSLAQDAVVKMLPPEGTEFPNNKDKQVAFDEFRNAFEYSRLDYGGQTYVLATGSEGVQCGAHSVGRVTGNKITEIWPTTLCGDPDYGFAAFSPDFRYGVISGWDLRGDGPIKIFDFKTMKPLSGGEVISGLGPSPQAVAFRPDGRQFVTKINDELMLFEIIRDRPAARIV